MNQPPTAVIFVGIQGAGKSTHFARHYADTHVRLNLDMLRTRHREAVLLHACLAIQQSFVLDATNPTAKGRARFIAAAKAAGFEVVAVVFEIPVELALARNRARTGRACVPDEAVLGTFAKLEPVTDAEGFDRVVRVAISDPTTDDSA
jgi:predicted kinase